MARYESRSQLMKRLGAVQLNTVWSWCAVNEAEKKVFFSIWTDMVHKHDGKTSYFMQELGWGVDESTGRKSPARNDQDAKFELVFQDGYEPYGYFIEAKDRKANPREIASTHTSFIMQLTLSRLDDGSIIGAPVRRVEIR